MSRQVPKVTVPYRYNPYQSSVLGRRTVICVAKDRISKWALILKGLNWLSISDFWSAWINKAVDSISIIVASWQKDKASVVMSPESNIYDLFFVHKIPSGQLSRIYIQKSTEPGQTPSKTILNRENFEFLRFLIVGKTQIFGDFYQVTWFEFWRRGLLLRPLCIYKTHSERHFQRHKRIQNGNGEL